MTTEVIDIKSLSIKIPCRRCGGDLDVNLFQREVRDPVCGEVTFITWNDVGVPSIVPFESDRKG